MSRSSPSSSFSHAGKLLASGGRRMILVEAILLCLPTVGAYILLGRIYAFLYGIMAEELAGFVMLTSGYVLLLCALTLFLALPQLYGFLKMCRDISHDVTPMPIDLFAVFSDADAYRRVLALSWRAFLRMLCLAGAIALTNILTTFIWSDFWFGALACTLAVAVECLIWWGFVLRDFFRAAAVLDRSDISFSNRHGGMRFAFACLPRVLLGFLTLGVYLLWDVIPRIGISYFDYCRQLQLTLPTEEYKKHE